TRPPRAQASQMWRSSSERRSSGPCGPRGWSAVLRETCSFLLRSTTPPTLRARRLEVVGARSDPSSYQPMPPPPTQVGGRRPRTGCLKHRKRQVLRTRTPAGLDEPILAEPALHRATLGRPPPAACAHQPVEGRASSVSFALVSTKR